MVDQAAMVRLQDRAMVEHIDEAMAGSGKVEIYFAARVSWDHRFHECLSFMKSLEAGPKV